jgi:hypothetical protein
MNECRRINKKWLVVTVLALLVSCAHHRGCEVQSHANARSMSRTCEVHDIPLQEMSLPMHDNCTLPDEVYSSACAELFPYAPELFLDPNAMSQPVWMHICPRCWYEQQQWLRKTKTDPEPSSVRR